MKHPVLISGGYAICQNVECGFKFRSPVNALLLQVKRNHEAQK